MSDFRTQETCDNTLGQPQKTPTIDLIVARVNDAIGRSEEMRTRLAQRNDRLFGCVPCDVNENMKSPQPEGVVNELQGLVEILHSRMTLIDEELSRQDGLL